jgi:DNA-binding NarL/FixJ family response regulator
VLLDLDMPKVSGLAWLRKIRSRAKGKTLPVVILTAGTARRQLREAKKSDANIMLSKTAIHPKTVVEAINLAAGRPQTMT